MSLAITYSFFEAIKRFGSTREEFAGPTSNLTGGGLSGRPKA